MRVLSVWRTAVTYGLLGGFAALVSHELGYAGVHSVGVDHSHISVIATWFAIPALLAVARLLVTSSGIRLGRLIPLALGLLIMLEVGERVVQAIPLTSVLSTPVLFSVAAIPIGAALVLVPLGIGRGLLAAVRWRDSHIVPVDAGPVASLRGPDPRKLASRATCARSPPFDRPNGTLNERIGAFRRCEGRQRWHSRSPSRWRHAAGTSPG